MKRTMLVTILLTTTLISPIVVHAAPAPTAKMTLEKVVPSTSATTPAEVSPTPTPTVDYTLPYPGMLSDNPLYFLKQFRDWIMNLLIADPLRKVDFYVLQSDKDLNATLFLNAKNKADLANKALQESSAYMDKAVNSISVLKNQGTAVPGYVTEQLQKSLSKHEELLTGLVDQVTAAQKPVFTNALGEMKKLESDILKFQ